MNRVRGFIACTLLTSMVSAMTMFPVNAHASEEGKRNTTIGLGAASAALLLTQKNKLPGLVAAGGAAYAYSRYAKSIHNRHQREYAARHRYHRHYRH